MVESPRKPARLQGFIGKGLLLGVALLAAELRADIQFAEVAQSLGLTYNGAPMGAAWGDVNGDGLPDVILTNHIQLIDEDEHFVLYVSDGNGGFSDATGIVGAGLVDMHGASWVDVDNDGDQDLYISVGAESGTSSSPHLMLINDGTSLVDQAAALGIDRPFSRGRHAAWYDWNNDGRLDLFMINVNERPVDPQEPSRLYTFDPTSGQFIPETTVLHNGLTSFWGKVVLRNLVTAQPVFALHTKADFPDALFTIDPASGLSEAAALFAFPNLKQPRDGAFADFDGDGATDFLIAGHTRSYVFSQAAGGVINNTVAAGIDTNTVMGMVTADFDNDMDLDIYLSRSSHKNFSNKTNQYFENQGDGTFIEIGGALGAAGPNGVTTGTVTTADYDNDGFMDLLVMGSEGWFSFNAGGTKGPMLLYRNEGNSNHWLKIVLAGTTSNRDGIGAIVEVSAGGKTQYREQHDGTHFFSQDDRRLHFGLGSSVQAASVTVTWPSGVVQQFFNVAADQILTIGEDDPAGTPNQPPVAQFSDAPQAGTLAVDFDAGGSTDADGMIASYGWDFGDGNTGGGQTLSHTFATAGVYVITLTVTDDEGAIGTSQRTLTVSDGSEPQRVDLTVVAVGAREGVQANATDQLSDGAQNLATRWRSGSSASSRWITFDAGVTQNLLALWIAPDGSFTNTLEIEIGDQLNDGQVNGGTLTNCVIVPTDFDQSPEALSLCSLPGITGRYITVRLLTDAVFRIYGAEAYRVAGDSPNLPPVAAFDTTPTPGTLDVTFDASASSDPDGEPLISIDWDFGDGSTASGPVVSKTFAAAGTYTVTLTVQDAADATTSTQQTVTVSDSVAVRLLLGVHAVGARASRSDDLIDLLPGDAPALESKWLNDGDPTTAWVTMDAGAAVLFKALHLAPRGDRDHELDLHFGDTPVAGKVTSLSPIRCSIPATGVKVPEALSTCPLPAAESARFVTIEAVNRSRFTLHHVEGEQ